MLSTLLTCPGQVGQRVLAFGAECNHLFHVQHLHFGNVTEIQSNSFSDLALFTGCVTETSGQLLLLTDCVQKQNGIR